MGSFLIDLMKLDLPWLDQLFKKDRPQVEIRNTKEYLQALNAEKEIYKQYGVDAEKDIRIYNANIDDQFVHTVNAGNNNNDNNVATYKKPVIVCIHGYWSSSLAYVKLLKPLAEKFNVYCIDLPGQALSSRPNFDYQDSEEILKYFTNSIEEWRKSQQIEKFSLVGHSFGGYLAGFYAVNYPQHINNLVLLSPAGIKHERDLDKVHEGIVYFVCKTKGLLRDIFFQSFDALWKLNETVSGMYKKPLFPSRWLLNNYLDSQLVSKKINSKVYQTWFEYYDGMMSLPVSSEKAMTGVLNFPSFSAKKPLELSLVGKFQNYAIPVHFYFGETDWMESETSKKLIETQSVKGTFQIVPGAGHKVAYQNPEFIRQQIEEKCRAARE